MSENYLKDLFINEAKPALDKFKGAGVSGPAVFNGSLTPAENLSSVEIDVGGSFKYFVIHAIRPVTGYSVKASHAVIVNTEDSVFIGTATNNSGSAHTVIVGAYTSTVEDDYMTFAQSETIIKCYKDKIHFKCTNSGTNLGYFVSGMTYLWFAW